MTKTNKKMAPSLLEPQARGGDTAQAGFSFQEQVTLSHVPRWLAQAGFTAMTCEAMGDTEAKLFVPGQGFLIELVEAKNHALAPSEFWSEIDRFQEINSAGPGTYAWFTLASTGLSKELMPLVNGLRRVRGLYAFYEEGSGIRHNSFDDYVRAVRKLGRTDQEAHFLFEKVLIEAELSTAQSHGEAVFGQALVEYLPEYRDLSMRTAREIYASLGTYVRGFRNQAISRTDIEARIREKADPNELNPLRPVGVYTATEQEEGLEVPDLRFDWAPFFGAQTRSYPPPERWNQKLLSELEETRDWVIRYRSTRRVRLGGNRRLSASLAIGSVFSAVAGFAVEMDYRGEIWATDAHPDSNTPEYPIDCGAEEGDGEDLIVSVGILREVASQVESDLKRHGLSGVPRLHIHGEDAVVSPEHANVAAVAIKSAIAEALERMGSKQVHLFFAGPSFLALCLGHRLNATAPIQCYEWISTGNYVPTCRLFRDK
jgi:hypothetical protein